MSDSSSTTPAGEAGMPEKQRAPWSRPLGQLTKGQRITIWAGITGAALGCTAWLLSFAALAGDWASFALTAVVILVAILFFGKVCAQPGSNRFLWMVTMVVVLTGHCLLLFWLKFEDWRGGVVLSQEVLYRERRTVVYTVSAAVGLLGLQFALMHWLLSRSKRRPLRKL